jgi:ankyrin repeat domain-containing protein 50
LEKITDKIHYFVEIENLYWSAENVVKNSHFEDALVKLYREILAYESKCAWYFSRRTPNRTVRNILKIDGWADLMKDIDACENQCLQFSQILSHANQAKFQAVLSQQLEDIQLSLNRRYEIESQNKEVITWVSKVAVFDDHVNVRNNKLGSAYWNSGKWLLQKKQEFLDWKKSSHGQFWLQGTVGTGKTCLTSIVISHLIETVTNERLGIFYCSREKEYNRPIDVLRSLVAQLSCSADGEVIPDIKTFYEDNVRQYPNGSVVDIDQCISFLVQLRKFHGCTTIAIDALDECTDPRGLLLCLETVCERSEKLKLFFSSRDGVLVREQFPNCSKVRADSAESSGDIQDFIEGELGNPKRRNSKVITEEMANRLKESLIQRAGGM